MNYIEILRELKLAYEYLLDIRDNTPNPHTKQAMDVAIEEVSKVYYDTYEEESEKNSFANIKVVDPNTMQKHTLSCVVSGDYIDDDGDAYTCIDVDFYWYEHSINEIYPEKMEEA